MGATFGIALTLIVFAGAELFTGHTMYMAVGSLRRRTRLKDLAALWLSSWTGNLAGSFLLAVLFVIGGGGMLEDANSLINKVAAYKMNSAASALVARGILCNWLVCLALWMSSRTSNDAAKCIVIFWCLLAFIASGFEHSVANMTLLSLSLLASHPETVTIGGFIHNLAWVTIGNTIGGAVFMGLGYYIVARPELEKDQEEPAIDI